MSSKLSEDSDDSSVKKLQYLTSPKSSFSLLNADFRFSGRSMTFTREQILELEKQFQIAPYPDLKEVAANLKLNEEVVKAWFNNRRKGSYS